MAEKVGSIYYDLDLNSAKFNQGITEASSKVTGLSGIVQSNEAAFKALAATVAVAMIAVVKFGTDAVKAYNEQAKSLAELGAVIGSTGGVAGVTAESAIQLAQSLQKVTKFSDESIEHGEALLLTFTNIGKDVFPQAVESMLNMSQIMGIDLQESAVRLGRALQDPIKGTQLLRRSGIDFTDQQIQMFQTLVNTGRGLEAQKLILQELDKELGNQARMYGETLPGKMAILGNAFNDLKETIGGMIQSALAPLVRNGTSFIVTNEKMIVSLAFGAAAAIAFAAVIIAVVGAITLAVAIMGGPLVAILVLIASLMGVVVYKAVGNLFDQFKKTANGISEGSKSIGKDLSKAMGDGGQAADDLARKLADLDVQMMRSESTFQQSMAGIVDTHQKAINDIQGQLADLAGEFASNNDERTQNFTDSTEEETKKHEEESKKLKKQYDDLAAWGNRTDRVKLQAALDAINAEDARHEEASAKLKKTYETETAKAKAEYDKKQTALQKSLDAEMEFIRKHESEVASVKNVYRLDEIDKLKLTHAQELQDFQKQRDDLIRNSGQAAAGVNANFATIGSNLPGLFNNLNLQAAISGTAIKNAFVGAIKSALWTVIAAIGNTIPLIFNGIAAGLEWLIRNSLGKIPFIGDAFKNTTLPRLPYIPFTPPPGFAKGVKNFMGGLAVVGEEGPELAYLPQGTNIYSNDKLSHMANSMDKMTPPTHNITIQAGAFLGTPGEARKFAEKIMGDINKLQRSRGIA